MDDSSPISPFEPELVAFSELDFHEEAARRAREKARRRLKRLLALGCALFTLIVWLFVRSENPAGIFSLAPSPARIVRQHLEALNRGQLREAYLLFSQHYRSEVPFEAYHELVVTHSAMFRTRIVSVSSTETSGNRVVLETRLLAADGERYRARFTLVRSGDRWWIDDLRWGADSGRRYIIST